MDREIFVQNIKSICKLRGIAPTAACKESGVGGSFINDINRGQTPSVAKVQLLAQYLSVTTSELLGEEKPASPAGRGQGIPPPLTNAALKLAQDYDSLDSFGKKQLRDVADNEIARCEDEARFLADTAPPEEEPKVIPLYLFPAAAGYVAPVLNEDYELYTLKPEDPKGAVFAVRLQGDSMEPDFPDGSIVFCNRDPLADGDIGVFYVDGGTVCKQYHKEDPAIYLFSLNRKRQDADIMLLASSNRAFSCQGRVITKKRYRLPGR